MILVAFFSHLFFPFLIHDTFFVFGAEFQKKMLLPKKKLRIQIQRDKFKNKKKKYELVYFGLELICIIIMLCAGRTWKGMYKHE